ncbi:hypothetical protein C8F01DRAFT_1084452 [Mycena amicta]|nr:hypothetical protein C8F01DRAFT_1084452 [Mycena amicta]
MRRRVSEASWNMEQQHKSIKLEWRQLVHWKKAGGATRSGGNESDAKSRRRETSLTRSPDGGNDSTGSQNLRKQRDAIGAKRTGTGMSIEQLGTDLGREKTREARSRCKDSDACTMKGTLAGMQNTEKREGGNDVGSGRSKNGRRIRKRMRKSMAREEARELANERQLIVAACEKKRTPPRITHHKITHCSHPFKQPPHFACCSWTKSLPELYTGKLFFHSTPGGRAELSGVVGERKSNQCDICRRLTHSINLMIKHAIMAHVDGGLSKFKPETRNRLLRGKDMAVDTSKLEVQQRTIVLQDTGDSEDVLENLDRVDVTYIGRQRVLVSSYLRCNLHHVTIFDLEGGLCQRRFTTK